MYNIHDILRCFGINASEIKIERISTGHVNETFKIYSDCGQYILQKINTDIFLTPDKVMHNIGIAQTLICDGMTKDNIDASGKIPAYISANGKNFLIKDGFWRIYKYIESVELPPNKASVEVFGKLLGQFHRYTEIADISKLYVTIDGFHDIEKNISAAIKCDGISDKAKEFFNRVNKFFKQNNGCLSAKRLVHNDVKWANVLINPETLLPEAIIDYDTVMEGYAAFDFGDAVRSACITNDFSIDIPMLASFNNGYKSEYTKLFPEEKALGILSISAELSARYLYSCLSENNGFPGLSVSERLLRHENMLRFADSILKYYDKIIAAIS